MMGPVWLWLLVAEVLLPVHCQPFSPHGEKSLGVPQPAIHQLLEPAPAYHKVTPTITNFALRLYKQLAEEVPRNILFSPVSLSSILALLSLGAPADTQIQILESLGFNLTETPAADIHRGFQSLLHTLDLPSPKLELKVGHSLFLDRQLKPQQRFLDSAKELYGALAFSANFTDAAATGQQINDLVRKQTYGQVVDSLPEFGPDTIMTLLNYIFFKAKWKHPFDRYQTRKQESISREQRTALRIPMMRQKEMHRFLYDQEASCTVLQIEYSGTALLLLVLPDPGKMQQVEAALQPETLRRWSRRFLPSLLDLHLPRFSISASYNLEEILPLIGLGNMFDLEADLSGIMGQLNRTVSRHRQSFFKQSSSPFTLPEMPTYMQIEQNCVQMAERSHWTLRCGLMTRLHPSFCEGMSTVVADTCRHAQTVSRDDSFFAPPIPSRQFPLEAAGCVTLAGYRAAPSDFFQDGS
ncbi:serpin A11 isoform X1 [Arvicola amphibius]|uniref:serpin A11 isoform X1 n=1 Tax=Arvicola amphibius TaxID=1047088 RepID=UPI0018E2ABAA|nr:serpin A11 isoform X1 [Arvicola amphibius]XP_038193427.1 serpin A11 isoform X1 [Arvicola amphibius]